VKKADIAKELKEGNFYVSGKNFEFPKYKKDVPVENLWLKVACRGAKKYEEEFLKKDGEYFVVGRGKCPRCEEEITLKHIEGCFGVYSNSTSFREDVVKYLNNFIKERKNTDKPIHLNTCLRKAHFFAQVGAETLGINTDWIVETDVVPYGVNNINTSLFGDRATKLQNRGQVEEYCNERPQKKLLSFLYANENSFGNGNGNEASGDGYKFRGRGLKQLTGRDNYKNASITLKEIFPDEYVDLEANPDKVKEAKYAVLSAIAYWEKHEIWKTADTIKESSEDNIKKIRRMVNGGTAGWKDAKKFFEKGVEVFKVNECSPVESLSGEWRNPVDNPQITIYIHGGLKRPWRSAFGNVRTDLKAKDGVSPRPHHGLDLFAEIGTNVYACLPGKVVSLTPGTGYGSGFVLKVDSAYLEAFKTQRRNYDLYYIKSNRSYNSNEYNIAGYGDFTEYAGITDSEEVYFMYAHLSEVTATLNEEITIDNYKTKILGKTGDTGASGTKGPHLHFEIRSKLNPSGYSDRYNPAYYIDYKNEDQLTNNERNKQDQTANN
jgi:predicted chitinase